jgi:hypothetical protein
MNPAHDRYQADGNSYPAEFLLLSLGSVLVVGKRTGARAKVAAVVGSCLGFHVRRLTSVQAATRVASDTNSIALLTIFLVR